MPEVLEAPQSDEIAKIDHAVQPEPQKPAEKAKEQGPTYDDKIRERFQERMFGKRPVEEKKEDKASDKADDKKAAKKEVAAADAKVADDKSADKKDDKPKTALKPKPAAPAVDLQKTVKDTVEATIKGMREEKKEEKKADPLADIPTERRRDYEVFERLGKAEAAKKFFAEERDYIREWKKANAGKKFDPDADEHNDFYEQATPDYDEGEFEDARISLRAEKIADERLKEKFDKELKPMREKLVAAEVREQTAQAEREMGPRIHAGVMMVAEAISPDFAKLIAEGKTLEEADEHAHELLSESAKTIVAKTRAASILFATNGQAFDEKNPVHNEIAELAETLEKRISEEPEEKQVRADGAKFTTRAAYMGMTPAEREKHWIVNADIVSLAIAGNEAGKVAEAYKKENERMEKLAEKRGWTKSNATAKKETRSEDDEETTAATEKPNSPSTSAQSVLRPGEKVKPETKRDGGDLILGKLFPKA